MSHPNAGTATADTRRSLLTSGAGTLARYLRPHRAVVAALAAAMLVYTALQVSAPQFLRHFIDGMSAGAALSTLLWLAVAYLGVAVFAQVLLIAAEYFGAAVAWTATNDLRTDLTAHCLALDMPFYQEHSPGELIDRIDGDVGKLANYFSQMVLLVLANLLLIVGVGVALFAQDWRIGLVYAPFVLVSFGLLRRLVGTAVPAMSDQREANAKLLGFLEERLGGLADLRANGARGHTMHGFWLRAATLFRASRRARSPGRAAGR
jgi:ATP-binding cassette subfamily B protein